MRCRDSEGLCSGAVGVGGGRALLWRAVVVLASRGLKAMSCWRACRRCWRLRVAEQEEVYVPVM